MKAAERIVRRSVLDRLIQSGEQEPRNSSESIRMLKDAVMRDVEWILNTRRIAELAPSHLTEVNNSVYHYGLADITSVSAGSPSARRELLRRVEQCVERFEPRLSSVRVSEPESEKSQESSRAIRFHIEAVLRYDDEPIFFDTVLDPASGRFNVPRSQ